MANLYDKASLVLPSSPAYKAGVIQAYKPLTDGGTFDFTRATSANRINSDNLIESVGNNVPRMDYTDGSCPSLLLEPQSTNLINYPVSFNNSYWTKSGASIEVDKSTAGSELVTNGDFATDTDWTKQSSWTISGGTANYDAVVNSRYIQQPLVLISGNTYKIEFEVVSGTALLGFYSDSNIILPITAYGVGSHTVYGTTGLVGSNFRMWAASALGAFSIDNVSVKELQGFTSPSADEPLGAFKLVESSANEAHYTRLIQTTTSGQIYSASIFAKKGERDWIGFYIDSSLTYFNLDSGTIGTTAAGVEAKIEELSNGWYRCIITRTVVDVNQNIRVFISTDGANVTYTGDGTSGVYLFGAQLEQQSYPTSFIYNGTEGSSVTRVADACSKTGISDLIGQEQGTMFLEAEAQSGFRAFSICDGSTSNRISIVHNVPSSFRVIPVYGGVVGTQLSASYTSGNIKIAVAYGGGNYSMFVNGVKINSTSIGTFSSTLNKIEFAQGNGGNLFAGDVKQSVLFQTALTDSECIALTTL